MALMLQVTVTYETFLSKMLNPILNQIFRSNMVFRKYKG